MINYLVLEQDEVEENQVDDCFRSPEKSADFRFDQKLKKLSKRPRRTKRQQQIDTQHQNTQEVEPNLSQQTGTVFRLGQYDLSYLIFSVGTFDSFLAGLCENRV